MNNHPWAAIREGMSLTQLELAGQLNVTRQVVARLEQGMFHAPSSELLGRLSEIYEIDPEELMWSYNEYVELTRADFRDKHPSFKTKLQNYVGKEHPLVQYRYDLDLSRMGLCKGLCLDYGPVADYEYNRQRDIPDSLVKACKSIGWDWAVVTQAVAIWRLKGYANQ